MIIQLGDSTYYDNFGDAAAGPGVPDGWTMVGASPTTPTVVVDASANGGKHLSFPIGGLPYAMTMDIAGEPESFEILMKVKVDGECTGFNPKSLWGGPGGRISRPDRLIGIGVAAENIESYTSCGFLCQLGPDHYLYEPPASWNFRQEFYLKSRPSGGVEYESPVAIESAVSSISSGPTSLQSPDLIAYPGGVVQWSYMRLRVDEFDADGNPVHLAKAKWWPATEDEPSWWMIDASIQSIFWPVQPGGVGAFIFGESLCSGRETLVDYMVISLDPDAEPPEVQTPQFTTECPLPPGVVGEAYSYQLTVEGL